MSEASIKQISNGIQELGEAAIRLGAWPSIQEDGKSISFSLPHPNVYGLPIPDSIKPKVAQQVEEINSFSFSSNITAGELRTLYKKFGNRLIMFRKNNNIKAEMINLHSQFPRKRDSISDIMDFDYAEAVKGIVNMLPDADKRVKAAELAAFELDKVVSQLEDEELRAMMKNIAYNTLSGKENE